MRFPKSHGGRTPPVGDGVGYGYAAIETIKAIQRQRVKVSYKVYTPKVFISFVQPDFYDGIPEQYRVGYTPWESSEIPDYWPSRMREMDEIWTTCNYIKDIYESYNVNETIKVIPHGIDPEIWKIENRYLTDKFIFFHVGGPTDRKGGQRVVDAFLSLFGDNEDVFLLMKSNGPSEARYYDKKLGFGGAYRHPRIHVIESYISTEDLVKLYNRSHCLVYPTNGEGFGLIPFQGIASGLPTICTNATGCADFASMSVPLDSKPTAGQGIHLGDWVEPDFHDLCEKMLYVYNNFDEVKEKTLQSASIIHTTQTWDHIALKILDELGDKIYEKV